MLREMDGPVLIGALLGITCVVSRPMMRAFGTGPVAAAKPAPWRRSRLEDMLSRYDWELLLGLRYDSRRRDVRPPQAVAQTATKTSPATVAPEPLESAAPIDEERFLLDRLEAELVRATVQSVLDRLSLIAREEEPAPQEGRVQESAPTSPPPASAQQPPAKLMAIDFDPGPEELINVPDTSAPRIKFAVVDAGVGQPVGAPGFMDFAIPDAPVDSEALIPLDNVALIGRFATLDESVGQPVGAPSFHEHSISAIANAPIADNVTEVDFRAGQSEEEYRLAASLRKAGETYAIAAYTLNPNNNASSANGDDENHDTPDPLEELLDEILEPPPPEKDPNELELPLGTPGGRDTISLAAGQPVGAPDWFAVDLAPIPTREEPADEPALDANDEDEPSGPVAREINRISERVESILSNALARPAPAIDFSDALAEISDRSRQRKADRDAAAERLPSQALEDNLARSGDRDGGLSMAEYKVQFEIFEGPLDLLLYLVRKQEVDIYEVNLTQIAGEFIRYIEMMRQFDLEVAGEFLVMASTLMYIKSKELLPVEQQSQLEDEEEEDDPRWELIRQLVEYKKFKDAAGNFKTLELAQEDVFPRNPAKPDFPVQELKPNVSVFDLIGAVNKILERIDAKEEREIFADRWTVSEKIEIIRAEIEKQEVVKFTELFEDALSRTEVVATFLAVLELIKLKVIVVEQPDHFNDIEIRKSPPGHKLNLDDEQEELALEGAGSEYDAPAAGQE